MRYCIFSFREKIDASDLGMQNVKLRNILSILKPFKNKYFDFYWR